MSGGSSDLLLAARGLARQPAFALSAMALLAAGLAIAGTVFAVLDAAVFAPTALPDADRLVVVGSEMPAIGLELGFFERLSGPESEEIRQRVRALEDPLVFDLNSVAVRGEEAPRRLFAAWVDGDPMATFGTVPVLGRSFTADEIDRGDPVTLLAHETWTAVFAADPAIVGRVLTVDGEPRTVIGVAPPFARLYDVELWLPRQERPELQPRSHRPLNLVARRAPGQDLEAVRAELAALARAVEAAEVAAYPEYRGWRLDAIPWQRMAAMAEPRDAALVLAGVGAGLILACVNLAGLLVARVESRRRELAVRWALGAGAWRAWRPTVLETVVLVAGGTVAGAALVVVLLPLVEAGLPVTLRPTGKALTVDWRVGGFFAAAATLALAVLALVPALLARQRSGPDDLRGGRGGIGLGRRRLEPAVARLQVALAVVLVVTAGLATTAVVRLAWQSPGWAADEVVSMRITRAETASEAAAEAGGESVVDFFADVTRRVASWTEVEEVSIATQVLPDTYFAAEVEPEPSRGDGEGALRMFHTVVGDRFFETVGLPLQAGRSLDARDRRDGPCAAVVNATAARRLYGTTTAVGRRLRVVGSRFDSGSCEVVGVAATVANAGPTAAPAAEVFTSHRQAGERYRQMYLVVRTSEVPPASLVPRIRATLAELDPDQPLYAVATGSEALAAHLAPRRATATLFAAVAVGCLFLAGLGIHATVRFRLARRSAEMGLRTALGASRRELLRWIFGDALRLVAPGVVAGVALAALTATSAAAFGGSTALADRLLWLLAAGVALVFVALLATLGPARRAVTTAPSRQLREP